MALPRAASSFPHTVPPAAGTGTERPHPVRLSCVMWQQRAGTCPPEAAILSLVSGPLTCTGPLQGPTQHVPIVVAFCKIYKKYSNCNRLRLQPLSAPTLPLTLSLVAGSLEGAVGILGNQSRTQRVGDAFSLHLMGLIYVVCSYFCVYFSCHWPSQCRGGFQEHRYSTVPAHRRVLKPRQGLASRLRGQHERNEA